ncbi:MAG TPA: hypothetical protein VI685_14500 [Candidatus Angelobacter sp.]
MRFLPLGYVLLWQALAVGQGTPPPDPAKPVQTQEAAEAEEQGSPPQVPDNSNLHRMKLMIKKRINKAIDGKYCPDLKNWQPLTAKQRFEVFRQRLYSPLTFAAAGIDALKDSTIRKRNPEYERGLMGFGQEYGVYLGVSETEVFFGQFLMPALLKQDPRYFRNPELPFFKRTLYSLSRVMITRSDKGYETFNIAPTLAGAASQALSDLYVPGQRQGLRPILGTAGFNLVRDAGFNLLHEFWPDLRRKIFHR